MYVENVFLALKRKSANSRSNGGEINNQKNVNGPLLEKNKCPV